MKRILINILFTLTNTIDPSNATNAAVFQIEESTAYIYYIICGLFVLIGVAIIIFSKFSNGGNKTYIEDNNDISNLIDKKKDLNTNKSFDADSIFKTIPTFATGKFFNETFEELKNKIIKKGKVKDVILKDKSITDFKDNNDKYIIETEFIVEENDSNGNKMNNKYKVISHSNKEVTKYDVCPNCGGKIKDPTKLRCKYCGNILPKTETKATKWKIEKFESEVKNEQIDKKDTVKSKKKTEKDV